MPGYITNGAPLVQPPTVNGVNATPPNGIISNLSQSGLVSVDVDGSAGVPPQTAAATAFQIAAMAASFASNTATASSGAATLSRKSGVITSDSLSTTVGATYTLTLTNTLVTTASNPPTVAVRDGTNTTGSFTIQSVTNNVAANTVTIVLINNGPGAATANGTVLVAFHLN